MSWILAALLLVGPLAVFSANQQYYDPFTKKVKEFFQSRGISEGTVGVMTRDKLSYAEDISGYGQFLETTESTSLIPMLRFSHHLSSLVILQLHEEGRIDIKDKIFETDGILTNFMRSVPDGTDPRVRDVTILNLIQETAGWGRHDELEKLGTLLPSAVISQVLKRPMHSNPGEKFKHSPFNEFLMRIIIEILTERGYEDSIKHRILIPLGMWRTRLHHQDGERDYTGDETRLMNTVWYMTVYDIMRLLTTISGHSNHDFLRRDSLRLLFKRPNEPYQQHSDTWHGVGFRVKNDGSFWIEVSDTKNYLLLYSSGNELSATDTKHAPAISRVAAVVHLRTDDEFLYKHLLSDLFDEAKTTLPTGNLNGIDLQKFSLGNRVIMYDVPEQHFSAYAAALKQVSYIPTWVSAYTYKENTYFVVVTKRSNESDPENDWLLEHGLTEKRVRRYLAHRRAKGYHLESIQNYVCYSHDAQLCHLVFLRRRSLLQDELIEINSHFQDFLLNADSYNQRGYIPVVQSIDSRNGHKFVSAILQKTKNNSFRPFIDLDMDEFERVIYQEALNENNLFYLDTYYQGNELKFSAVFKAGQPERWILQQELKLDNLDGEISNLMRSHLFPRIVVGYERNGTVLFSALYSETN